MVRANRAKLDAAPISVVIPAYNASAYLRTTLESVFAQSMQPHEVIVVNDGSTDDTVAIAESFGATVISLENHGPSAARNAGTQAAGSEFIAYLDADDIWAPEKLALQLAALRDYSKPAFSFTDFRRFDSFGVHRARSGLRAHPAFRRTVGIHHDRTAIVISADPKRPVLRDMYFLPSSVLVRRDDVLAVGGFDESLRAGEDHEFFLRLFARIPALAVMRPLLFYRRHALQLSASPIAVSLREFEIVSRVTATPAQYPSADAKYMSGKSFLLHYRIGICDARLGRFDESIVSFKNSLVARRTLRAGMALFASRFARSGVGRSVFHAARALRRSRRERRFAKAELSRGSR